MNREQAKQLLPIIQAFADGADVQYRLREPIGREWRDMESGRNPSFEHNLEWRIKPKPLEAWLVTGGEYGFIVCADREDAEANVQKGGRIVLMREVAK